MSRALVVALLVVAGLLAQDVAAQSSAAAPRYDAWTWEARPLASTPGDPLDHARLPDDWLGRDKALHAGVSFLTTLSAQYVLTEKLDASEGEALPIAAGATVALGIAKEVMDSRRPRAPHFCTRDLVADAVGVLLAVGVVLL